MKILILGFTKIKYMPYLNMYLNGLDKNKHEIHLLYWARDNNEDSILSDSIKLHKFDVRMDDSIHLSSKLAKILRYSRFAKKCITEIDPDFLIVLHSTTAFTIKNLLLKKYKNRFFFDYRDLTYETSVRYYGRTIKKIVEASKATFTSSDGFRFVLPNSSNVYTSHNIMANAYQIFEKFSSISYPKQIPVRVAFWGLLRHFEINNQIIDKLCNDCRFELHYYGRAQGKMLGLMNESASKYNNFYFHGEYSPEDKIEFAKNTDLIINLYDKTGTMLYAMANKYYDGLVFCIPQLCTDGTFMGEQCHKANVGYSCNPYIDSFANDVFDYYQNLDRARFIDSCSIELEKIMVQVSEDKTIIERGINEG